MFYKIIQKSIKYNFFMLADERILAVLIMLIIILKFKLINKLIFFKINNFINLIYYFLFYSL